MRIILAAAITAASLAGAAGVLGADAFLSSVGSHERQIQVCRIQTFALPKEITDHQIGASERQDRDFRERDFIQSCMAANGYALDYVSERCEYWRALMGRTVAMEPDIRSALVTINPYCYAPYDRISRFFWRIKTYFDGGFAKGVFVSEWQVIWN